MPVAQFSDKDIDDLMAVSKDLPVDYRSKLRMRARSYSDKYEEGQFEIEVQNVGTFDLSPKKLGQL